MRWIASFPIHLLCLFLCPIKESKASDSYDAPIHDNDYNKNNHHDDFFAQGATGCDIYLAPSELGGWGVYAARDLAQFEVVEIAKRYVPMKRHWLRHSVLFDYYYGYTWQGNQTIDTFGVVVAGMAMFYNHGGNKKRNVVFVNIGHEPASLWQDPFYYAQALAFATLRDIRRGEELLSSYGDDDDWFLHRRLTMRNRPPPLQDFFSESNLKDREDKYCSKVFSGLGHATLLERVLPAQERERRNAPHLGDMMKRFPIQDQPTAVTKEFVQAGTLLEMAPALVIPLIVVQDSPLAPIAIVWDDWNKEQKKSLLALRDAGAFRMKSLNPKSGRLEDALHFESSSAVPEGAVILPMAGNLAMVRKVGPNSPDSNCRLEIVAATSLEDSRDDPGSAGLVLKLIATSDIQAGEELRLNLPDSSLWIEKVHLLQTLASTGQPIPKHIVDTRDYTPSSPRSNDEALQAKTGVTGHDEEL